jgi:hypothetical protein
MMSANPSKSLMSRYASPDESFMASKTFVILLGGIFDDIMAGGNA